MYSRSRRLHNQMSRARAALNRPSLIADADRPSFPDDPDERHAYGLVVHQTYAIAGPPGTGISHYSITFAPAGLGETVQLVVLTRNEAIARMTVEAEGDPTMRFDVTYHVSQRPDGSYCKLLDALEKRNEP
jgi:hypothetical protein